MKILYFDNFRGFQSTFLPLTDVNFFVGENSTGKTSILKLIGILSSSSFWDYSEFNNNLYNLGLFNEIVSTSNSRQFFEIGLYEKQENDITAIKLQFIEQNNLPTLKDFRIQNSNLNIQVTIEGDLVKYRYKIIQKCSFGEEEFKNWIVDNDLREITFIKAGIDFFGIRSMLLQLISLIKSHENIQTKEIALTQFLKKFIWSAPSRTEALKTYDSFQTQFSSDGSHTPYLLKDMLKEDLAQYIFKRFGEDSGLFDNIEIHILGDERKPTSPFEILIILNGKHINLINVGYGVSQVLPILIEVLYRPKQTWFAIQQPEVHLHPRAQAAFGDFIYKSRIEDFQNFIIETHSDYIIDRFRLKMNQTQKDEKLKDIIPNTQLIFFERHESGNRLHIMKINSDGSYPDEQPEGFRDFFVNEQFQLITI